MCCFINSGTSFLLPHWVSFSQKKAEFCFLKLRIVLPTGALKDCISSTNWRIAVQKRKEHAHSLVLLTVLAKQHNLIFLNYKQCSKHARWLIAKDKNAAETSIQILTWKEKWLNPSRIPNLSLHCMVHIFKPLCFNSFNKWNIFIS